MVSAFRIERKGALTFLPIAMLEVIARSSPTYLHPSCQPGLPATNGILTPQQLFFSPEYVLVLHHGSQIQPRKFTEEEMWLDDPRAQL